MVTALVDTRERDLIPLLSLWPVKTLPVGDIWIGLSGERTESASLASSGSRGDEVTTGGLVIERKTTDDLEASIMDGRYREQRTRLTAYCQQRGARPLYVIEGIMDRLWGKLSQETLQKYLNRLMLRYGVAVIHTEGLEGTAALCKMLAAQLQEDPSVFVAADPAAVAYTSTLAISKKENRDNPRTFASGALQGCPGVSAAASEAILTAFGGTLAGVWAAEEAALAAVVVGKRKLGPTVAKRLWGLLHAS
jgi:ERCC4-type nuclease